MAEASLQRLLELSASLPDSAQRSEQRELVQTLARELNIALPDGAPPSLVQPEVEANDKPAIPEVEANGKPAIPEVEANGKPAIPEVEANDKPVIPEVEANERPVAAAREKFQKEQVHEHASAPPRKEPRKNTPPASAQRSALTGSNGASAGECDLSSADIKNAYDQVRDDSAPTNWLLLGYGSSKKTLELYGSGEGGLQEFVANLKQDEVTYGYVRVIYGDSQRSKFVFVTYVPEGLSGMSKAKANMHKPSVIQFLKYMHVEVTATTTNELNGPSIQAKLTAAAGANYGTGGAAPSGSEDYGSIKDTARSFFMQTETKGNKQNIVYHKGPLSDTTPVALQGRAGITEKYIKV